MKAAGIYNSCTGYWFPQPEKLQNKSLGFTTVNTNGSSVLKGMGKAWYPQRVLRASAKTAHEIFVRQATGNHSDSHPVADADKAHSSFCPSSPPVILASPEVTSVQFLWGYFSFIVLWLLTETSEPFQCYFCTIVTAKLLLFVNKGGMGFSVIILLTSWLCPFLCHFSNMSVKLFKKFYTFYPVLQSMPDMQ